MAAKKSAAPLFISFAPSGVSTGLGPVGDYLFKFESQLLLRYRVVDGVVVDLYAGLTDEEALAKILEEEKANTQKVEAGALYTIFKTTIIGRMTDEELAVFDAGYKAQDLRGRMMWDNCTSIVSNDPYGLVLRNLFTTAFGEDRSKVLMGPL